MSPLRPLTALCLLILPVALRADDAPLPSISLQDAVLSALRQNAALRVSKADVEIKEGITQQATGLFDWTVQASAGHERTRVPALTPLGTPLIIGDEITTYSVGATRLTRSGVVFAPNISVAQGLDDNGSGRTGASDLSLRILLPLLRGRGKDSTGAAEAAARGDVVVATHLYRHALASQAFATTAAYWSARASAEALEVQRDVERRASSLVESLKVLVDSRVFPPVYQLQTEANLREKTTVRRDAELREITARLILAQALGLKPEEVARAPRAADPLPSAAGDFDSYDQQSVEQAAIVSALSARSDYLAIRESSVPLEALARQAELDLKPRLDLSVAGGYRGYHAGANLLRPLGSELTGGNAAVGVVLEWPVRNHYRLGLVRERRAAVRQAEDQAAALATGIAAEVLTALAEVRLRAETVRSAAATVETARRALEGQQQQLRAGESSVLDVINLENLSSASRLSLIEAQTGYAIAVARLRYSLGAIFTPGSLDQDFALQDLTSTPSL